VGGLLISCLVAFAFHRVLGTLDREAMAMQDPSQLVFAEANTSNLLEVSCQSFGRPSGESVSQILGIGRHRTLHHQNVLSCRPTGPSGWFLWLEGFESALAVFAPNSNDGLARTAQSLGNASDRVAEVRHRDNQAIAKDVRRGRLQAHQIDAVQFLV